MTKTGINVDKRPRRVRHISLTKADHENPFRVWCPICEDGLLLVRQGFIDEGGKWHNLPPGGEAQLMRSRADRCTLCGQSFWYTDEVIEGGVSFFEDVSEFQEGEVIGFPQTPQTWLERLLKD